MNRLQFSAVALLALADFAVTPLCAQTLAAPAPVAAASAFSAGPEAAAWAARHVEAVARRPSVPDSPIRYADGRIGDLADFKGRVALVTIWKSDCPVCARELPVLDRLAGEMAAEGLAFAPLTLDKDPDRARMAFESWGLRHLPVIQDVDLFNGSLFAMEIHGRPMIATPMTYLVDRSGTVRASIRGSGGWDDPGAKAWLRAFMAAPG